MDLTSEIYASMSRDLAERMPPGMAPDLRAGSALRCILELFSKQLTRHVELIELTRSSGFIQSASGVYLDLHGEVVGIPRRRGSHQVITLEIRKDPSVDVTIAGGSRVYMEIEEELEPLVMLRTESSPPGTDSFLAEAVAVRPVGLEGIAEGTGALTESPITGVLSIQATGKHSVSSTTEPDDLYRKRIMEARQRSGPVTIQAISGMARLVEGVEEAYPYMDPRAGGGVATILVEAERNGDPAGVAQLVAERLHPIRPAGIELRVRPVENIDYDVDVIFWLVKVHSVVTAHVKQTVSLMIREHFDGLGLGQPPSQERLRLELAREEYIDRFTLSVRRRSSVEIPLDDAVEHFTPDPDAIPLDSRARIGGLRVNPGDSSSASSVTVQLHFRFKYDGDAGKHLPERVRNLIGEHMGAARELTSSVLGRILVLVREMRGTSSIEVDVTLTDPAVGLRRQMKGIPEGEAFATTGLHWDLEVTH